jgi:hypothetical protein
MKGGFSTVIGTVAVASISLTGLVQASSSQAAAQPQITVVGCVQSESDYRKARDAGRGGAAGTGLGVGNEFVLINASVSSGGAKDTAFELSGSNEGQVKAYMGKRVEITGTLKPSETDAGGRPTGGATAGRPPEGVDVTSKDLKLRELEVSTVKEASGTCPGQ